eukprot:TRINITY_DN1389_c0_g2_i1.p2 TRINITY_DN1389_c0_g2~~TRINITY_DN1389_c0_g2_i1.p2  ORF type:complete len:550 (+),score=221.87 TRINITY_DN1389_c0_g2_i1:77-1651(+)
MRAAAAVALAAALLPGGLAAPAGHAVKSLPGWNGTLPSRQWSGLIPSTRSQFHYWLYESESDDPSKDPLVLWYNGGPGASSMFGMMVELGPLSINYDSLKSDPPQLFYNEHAWTRVANVMAVEQPPPTGFSYCKDPAGGQDDCGDWNDTSAAEENYHFLLNWLEAFPEYKSRDLYISGESYAGIYVPSLARFITSNKDKNQINLKGIAVGDGCTGHKTSSCGGTDSTWQQVHFLYGHQQFSAKLFNSIMATCTDAALRDGTYTRKPGCQALITEMYKAVGGYYSYNLYDTCVHQGPFLGREGRGELAGALNDYACGGDESLGKWVDRADVRKALNVPENAAWNNVDGTWPEYHSTEEDLRPYYKALAEGTATSAGGRVRALVYSGDTDPSVKTIGTEEWTSGLGLNETEAWRPWTLDGATRMAGYVTRYEGGLDFVTIRGSGHMVPQMQPLAGLEFLLRWLKHEDWRPYKKDAQPLPLATDELDARNPRSAARRAGLVLQREQARWQLKEQRLRLQLEAAQRRL